MLQLWVHESQRVFGDRMWDAADSVWLDTAIDEQLHSIFSSSLEELFSGQSVCPPFAAFLRTGAGAAYQPAADMVALKVACQFSCSMLAVTPGDGVK